MENSLKIQKRLLLSILPVVITTVLAVTTVAIIISKNALENQVKENAVLLSTSYSSQVDNTIFQIKRMAEDLSAAIETAINVETVLINTRKRYPEINRIIYSSVDGEVQDMSPYNKVLLLSDFTIYKEWDRALESQEVVISNPIKYLDEDVFMVFSPVTIDYTVNSPPSTVGIAVVIIPVSYVLEKLHSVVYGETGSLFILNSEGTFIYHKDSSFIMEKKLTEIKSSTDLTLIQNAMVDLNSGIGSYFIKNEKNLISFSPIENAGWSLAITASYKEFTKRVNSVISFSSVILIIGLGLASWLIYLIVHGVTKPLTYLTEVSDKITNGDFSTRSILKIDNEVGHLSNSFNVMVDKLDNYNKNLEAEVLERTRELLVMNEELEATNETLDSNAREMEMLNEELQATNETLDQNAKEMEAMNEELKVSNESIEAVNEELMQTVDELDVSNKQLSATRDALWSEMELAQKLQTVLLPEDPKIDGFDISAFMTTTSSVGGDYYDVINIEGRDWFLIGDVSGHGVTSGLIMMMVQTSLHVALFQNPNISPVELLDVINKTIHSNIFKLGGSRYMTLTVFACLDEGRFTFAGAHLPLILHREKTDEIEMIETPGAWIGLIDDIQGFNEEREFSMEKGDSLLLYTDGITEATNEKGISFSQEKLAKLFKENVKLDAKGICESIKESSGNLKFDDDVSIMVLKKV